MDTEKDHVNPTEPIKLDMTNWPRVLFFLKSLMTHSPSSQGIRDGRGAYLHAKSHFLGTDMVNQQAQEAELRLQALKYTGDRKRFTFETFVTYHKESHQQLESLVEYRYKGIDEGSKARYLNNGVLCEKLAPVRASILSNSE